MTPVEVEIPTQAGWARVIDLLAATVAAGLAAWWFSPAPDMAPLGYLTILLLGLGATILGWSARGSEPGRLRWDGEQWWMAGLAPGAAPLRAGRLRVVIDLQFAMLLRFHADGTRRGEARWFAVGRRTLSADWHALRCAAFHQARDEAGPVPAQHPEARG